MFLGLFNHTLDSKNRVFVPAKFRAELSKGYVMTRSLDRCIVVYPVDQWEKVAAKLEEIPMTNRNGRRFKEFMTAGASDGFLDSQGRISLSPNQKSYANITKDVAIVGKVSNFEIWDSSAFAQYDGENVEMVSDDPSKFDDLGI